MTLTLEPDVARLLEEEVHRTRKPFKTVVNEALRRGLSTSGARCKVAAYRVVPHEARLLPRLDRSNFNALADELEDDAVAAKVAGPRS